MSGLHVERLGAGPRLVLVHGFTQTGRSWYHGGLAEAFAVHHEVLLVDAPGHGGSSAVPADLVAGADLLVAAGGRATYLGYSMGGRLALHAALAHPDAVERLVLLGATAGIEDPVERAARRAADETLADDLERDGLEPFLARWLALPLFARLPAEATGAEDRRRNTVAGLATSLRLAGTGAQQSRWDDLAGLSMPVLLIVGEHDAAFRQRAERMATLIGANATTAVVPGAGHAAHLEQPTAFLQIVLAWLGAQPPMASPTANSAP